MVLSIDLLSGRGLGITGIVMSKGSWPPALCALLRRGGHSCATQNAVPTALPTRMVSECSRRPPAVVNASSTSPHRAISHRAPRLPPAGPCPRGPLADKLIAERATVPHHDPELPAVAVLVATERRHNHVQRLMAACFMCSIASRRSFLRHAKCSSDCTSHANGIRMQPETAGGRERELNVATPSDFA